MTRNRFKIIFKTKDDKTFDVDYTLHDSVVAEKWFRQIKHLRRIPIDKVESDLVDLSDLHAIYQEFCEFAGLDPIILGKHLDQPQLNRLHQIYEDTHDDLSRRKDNSSLYKFHRAIHFYESRQIDPEYKGIGNIGWGVKGGPLEVVFNCNPYMNLHYSRATYICHGPNLAKPHCNTTTTANPTHNLGSTIWPSHTSRLDRSSS